LRGGHCYPKNLLVHAVTLPLRTLAKRCKRLTPLLAAPAALLLSQGQAKAVLTYNIFESGGDVVVQASGSINLTGAAQTGTGDCPIDGFIVSSVAAICTGASVGSIPLYGIVGPQAFNGNAFIFASSVSGLEVAFNGIDGEFIIDSAYVSNTPIVSSATFTSTTLAGLGFTTTGLIGTWTLNGTSETIQVFLGPPAAAVPGPVPLLGAGAAFGWSRRLRKRIAAPLITTTPQA